MRQVRGQYKLHMRKAIHKNSHSVQLIGIVMLRFSIGLAMLIFSRHDLRLNFCAISTYLRTDTCVRKRKVLRLDIYKAYSEN